MAIRLSNTVPEKTTTGVKVTLYDANSDTVIPNSMNWYLFNSVGTGVASGTVSSDALSSSSLITLNSSLMVPSSGETRPELVRTLRVEAYYTDSQMGHSIENEVFMFTLVNNPGV